MRKLELLIPARDNETGMAAVDHGADAVYIGGPAFGARGSAGNSVEDIARLCDHAHPYGVRVYAALNTIIYENELRRAGELARELVSAGVDALIVQDTALLMMGIEGVSFHASTQMCNTTPEHVRFLGRSGFSRVVLERGMTIGQVREITAAAGVETECFVHGAICVGHSGRCYLSRSMGPRSGNRGVCGQPCRIKYDLKDGAGNTIIADKYLMSVKDLNLSGHLGELIDAGVTSFKVEGRLKDADYVKNITAYYRNRLDSEIAARKGFSRASDGTGRVGFIPDPLKSFSRGFTIWTAAGAKAGSASFDTPKSLGEPLGKVAYADGSGFKIDNRTVSLSPGDGICFFDGGKLAGTNINSIEGDRVLPNRMDGIRKGTEIYRNYDHRFGKALQTGRTRRAIAVQVEYQVSDDCLVLVATDSASNCAKVDIRCGWGAADNPEKMISSLQTQLAKSGGTVFDIIGVTGKVTGTMPFLPVSALNALRRELLDKLLEQRLTVFEDQKRERLATAVRDDSYPYPFRKIGGEGNVTNSLALKFWRMHGVEDIDEAFDLRDSLDGQTVMTTPYCLRRELGICLRDKPEPSKTLYLHSGDFRYRLDFDCRNCLMSLVKV